MKHKTHNIKHGAWNMNRHKVKKKFFMLYVLCFMFYGRRGCSMLHDPWFMSRGFTQTNFTEKWSLLLNNLFFIHSPIDKKTFASVKNSRGFTLVESMVAISILALSITGPMVIAQKGIASAIYARDQITAFYLAQEAIEYVRNVRDSNKLATPSISWFSQFGGCLSDGFDGKKCQIDARYSEFSDAPANPELPNNLAIKLCSESSGACPILGFETIKNLYGYDNGSGGSWTNSIFTRDITIVETVPGVEAKISVTISWRTGLFTALRTFTIEEYIFNF